MTDHHAALSADEFNSLLEVSGRVVLTKLGVVIFNPWAPSGRCRKAFF